MSKDWAIPPDFRFTETEYLCRPCEHEQAHELWFRWHQIYGIPWTQDSRGQIMQIGKIDNRPICADVSWIFVVTKRVALVGMSSQLADYAMLEGWCSKVFPNVKSSANPTNFHNIIGPLQRSLGVKTVIRRNMRDVLKSIESVPVESGFLTSDGGGE